MEVVSEMATRREVRVAGLRVYPYKEPADPKIQQEIIKLWEAGKSFVILSGPPGVGKTRAAEDFISELLKKRDAPYGLDDCRVTNLFPEFRSKVYSQEEIADILRQRQIRFTWDLAVLHPQYAYEDLIRGFRLVAGDAENAPQGGQQLLNLQVREGLVGFMARLINVIERIWGSDQLPNGCLILDEINRAPIGQLFGEALYALDRRGHAVTTPYELEGVGSTFTVPASMMILGTMNSVDRAVAGFDFALRRRFAFLSLGPRVASIETRFKNWDIARTIAIGLYKHISELIEHAEQAGIVPLSELMVGQAYFLPPPEIAVEEDAQAWLGASYQYQVLPILLDYQEQGLVDFKQGEGLTWEVVSGQKALSDLSSEAVDEFLRTFHPTRSEDNS